MIKAKISCTAGLRLTMMPQTYLPQSLYAAFDTFPAPKGAAIHIHHMTQVLFSRYSRNSLFVLGGEGLPSYQYETLPIKGEYHDVYIQRYSGKISNYLERALNYGQSLSSFLTNRGQDLEIIHFRDPWSGFSILGYLHNHVQCTAKTVFEVNGLPSIELPYAHPEIAPETLEKIYQQEQLCLENCDEIIVPSENIKQCLIAREISSEKIIVISNGADVICDTPKNEKIPDDYLIYFGALQQWQGIDDLLRIFSQLQDFDQLKLVICASKHNRIAKSYKKMAQKLGISDRIIWEFGLTQDELAPWIEHATLSIAPLTDCPRNIQQGCCPLKILESLAAGTPVVASDLPVVREIMSDKIHGRLCKPRRPMDFARVIRILLDQPEAIESMGRNAQTHMINQFSWEQKNKELNHLYDKLISQSDPSRTTK